MVNKKDNREYEMRLRSMFELGDRPSDITKYEGGNREEIEFFYNVWISEKKEKIKEGMKVACGIAFTGYTPMVVEGIVVKINKMSAIIESDDEYIIDNLKGRVAVPIKDIITI